MFSYVAGQEKASSSWFGAEEESSAWLLGGLTFTQRIVGFCTCLFLGILFCVLSTYMLLSPRAFAKFYTIGSMFLISSTFFLVGPLKQLKSMFQPQRAISTACYFGSLLGTLYAALELQRTGLTLFMIAIQFCSAVWYGASYIPFAQSCLASSAKGIWGNMV